MAVYVKYEKFAEDLANKIHDVFGIQDTFKVALSNGGPSAAANTVFADIQELAAGNGYTAGGIDAQNDGTRTGGVVTVTGVDVVWTAVTASMGPFRYAILYNETPAAPLKPLIAYWDYGSSITLLVGETFTVDFGASLFTVT